MLTTSTATSVSPATVSGSISAGEYACVASPRAVSCIFPYIIVLSTLKWLNMPRVSNRKKAKRAAGRKNIVKRWKKDQDDSAPTCSSSLDVQAATDATRFHPRPTESAANFRHSLLPPEHQYVEEVSENSGMYNISHQRLTELLNLVSCDECGTKSTWKITPSYFDCTVHVRCDSCHSNLLYSEPEKCKNSDLSKGNVLHVYHSLCEGYGRLGLSRCSPGMGTKEMSANTFEK